MKFVDNQEKHTILDKLEFGPGRIVHLLLLAFEDQKFTYSVTKGKCCPGHCNYIWY